MNFLAHAYLSFNDSNILTGNMISDFIKGRKQYDLPVDIQRGLQLHRAIDAFTDNHAATKKLKEFFIPSYRLYSGAFGDVVYDYFLANDKSIFPDENDLLEFTQQAYAQLAQHEAHLGESFQLMFPYMIEQNWLYNYRLHSGIEKSFMGLKRRSRYIMETETALTIFKKNENQMQEIYEFFFPELQVFAKEKLRTLSETGGLSLEQ